MNKLELSPDDNYNIEFASDGISTASEFILRYGVGISGKWARINASWTTDKLGYNYLLQAYRSHEHSGHVPFLVDFLVSDSTLREYETIILPGSFALRSVESETFHIESIMEVRPIQ